MSEASERRRKRADLQPLTWLVCLPALAGVAFLGMLIWHLPRLVEAISWNADALAPALIAERAAESGGSGRAAGPTVLGDISSASTLWFQQLTVDLPGHRALWAYWPAVLALASAALIGWSCWRLAGRWAALLGVGLVLAAGPDTLLTFLAPAFRGPSWLSVAMLSALLVHLCREPERPLGAIAAYAVPVAVIGGVNLASDPLLALAGVVPFLAAPALTWYTARTRAARRVTLIAAATSGMIVAVALTASAALHASGYVTRRERFGSGYTQLADLTQLADHVPLVGKHLLTLLGAPGLGGQITGNSALRWMFAGMLAVALIGSLWPRVDERPSGVGTPNLWFARRTYFTYWAIGAAAVIAGFMLSDIPADAAVVNVPGTRYLVPLALAGAACLPVILYTRDSRVQRRVFAAAAAMVVFVAGSWSLFSRDLERAQRGALPVQAQRIAHWLEEQGVDRGYAGYWSAGPMSYHTDLHVLAVRPCLSGRGETLCPVALNGRRDWYRPTGSLASFVMLDASRPGDAITPGAWRAAFGPPGATRRFGALTVRVYPYDIAERFTAGWRPYPDERLAARLDARRRGQLSVSESSSNTAHSPRVN